MRKLLLLLLLLPACAFGQKVNLPTQVRGILPCANTPALTGDVTSSSGSCTTVVSPTFALKNGVQQQAYIYSADTGGANAYAVTLSPAPTLVAGSEACFLAANGNTGASTLAVNGGSAKAIKKNGSSALNSGDIAAGQIVCAIYDGANFQLTSPPVSGAGTVTTSGTPAANQVALFSGSTAITGTATDSTTTHALFATAGAPAFRALQVGDLPVGFTAFSNLTSSTNTTAAMLCGTGCSFGVSGSGTNNATSLLGNTWAIPGTVGSTTPNTGAFTTLSASTGYNGPIGKTTPNSISSDMWLDCSQYSGATVDVKVNACLAAVISAGGGTADARGLGGNQSIAAQITVGDGTTPVTLLLPVQGNWSPDAITNGTDCAIQQLGNTSIISQNPGGGSGMIISSSSSAARLNAMYCSNSSGGIYLRLDGVKFRNQGHATTSGIGFWYQGSFDSSSVSNVTVYDFKDTYAAEIQHSCCSTSFYNFTVNGENFAGQTSLYIHGTEPSPPTNEGLVFYGLSVDAPGNGFPNIKIDDTGASHRSAVAIYGCYGEGSTTDTTSAFVQIDGPGQVSLYNCLFKRESGSGSTQPGVSLSNTYDTQLTVDGLKLVFGASFPQTAVVNSNTTSCATTPCNIPTNSKGALAHYATSTSSYSVVSSGRYATATNCAQSGTAANPSVVACGSAAAGIVYCDVAASAGTCTINTTAVGTNSFVSITPSTADGTLLSKTCNDSPSAFPAILLAAKVNATSFTLNMPTGVTNGFCFEYHVVN